MSCIGLTIRGLPCRIKHQEGEYPCEGILNAPERTIDGGALCPPSNINTTLLSAVVLWPVLLECLRQLALPGSTPSVAVTAMYAAQYLLATVYLSYMGGRVKDAEKLQDSSRGICVIGPDKKVREAARHTSCSFPCML